MAGPYSASYPASTSPVPDDLWNGPGPRLTAVQDAIQALEDALTACAYSPDATEELVGEHGLDMVTEFRERHLTPALRGER